MAEIRVHANGLTRAFMEVTDERSDITLATVTGATVIARAAAEWRDRLARLGQASTVIGERFPL